jgi:hypothetical protein
MHNLMLANVLAALIAAIGVTGADALGAELEGALQYPPSSIGKDAQPPAPAGMVRQPVFPRRIELGISGSSIAPGIQRFRIVPSHPFGEPAEPLLQSGSGG